MRRSHHHHKLNTCAVIAKSMVLVHVQDVTFNAWIYILLIDSFHRLLLLSPLKLWQIRVILIFLPIHQTLFSSMQVKVHLKCLFFLHQMVETIIHGLEQWNWLFLPQEQIEECLWTMVVFLFHTFIDVKFDPCSLDLGEV